MDCQICFHGGWAPLQLVRPFVLEALVGASFASILCCGSSCWILASVLLVVSFPMHLVHQLVESNLLFWKLLPVHGKGAFYAVEAPVGGLLQLFGGGGWVLLHLVHHARGTIGL
jgi:hypothetical protein